MKFITVSTLVAVALCSFMLVHTALGESNLLKVLKGSGKRDPDAGFRCFRRGRRGQYRWPVAYYKAANGASSGNYINLANLRVSPNGQNTIYPFNCDGADAGTGLCNDVKNEELDEHYCRKCSFTGSKQVNMMQGGKLNEKDKSGKLNIKLILSCRETYRAGKIHGKKARYTYRVEDNGSRRRRLLGMKDRDGECRL